MPTTLRVLRLDETHWRKLQEIAARVVPDDAVAPHTRGDASRITAMLRLIADDRLLVTRPPSSVKPSKQETDRS